MEAELEADECDHPGRRNLVMAGPDPIEGIRHRFSMNR